MLFFNKAVRVSSVSCPSNGLAAEYSSFSCFCGFVWSYDRMVSSIHRKLKGKTYRCHVNVSSDSCCCYGLYSIPGSRSVISYLPALLTCATIYITNNSFLTTYKVYTLSIPKQKAMSTLHRHFNKATSDHPPPLLIQESSLGLRRTEAWGPASSIAPSTKSLSSSGILFPSSLLPWNCWEEPRQTIMNIRLCHMAWSTPFVFQCFMN